MVSIIARLRRRSLSDQPIETLDIKTLEIDLHRFGATQYCCDGVVAHPIAPEHHHIRSYDPIGRGHADWWLICGVAVLPSHPERLSLVESLASLSFITFSLSGAFANYVV